VDRSGVFSSSSEDAPFCDVVISVAGCDAGAVAVDADAAVVAVLDDTPGERRNVCLVCMNTSSCTPLFNAARTARFTTAFDFETGQFVFR
jgi:hypothetical protein